MKRTGFETMSPYRYPFYICMHPRDGFLELRANKKGSGTVAFLIAAVWLFVELFYRTAMDFDMNPFDEENMSLLRTSIITVMMYVMVCVSNWCFCTLLDGKGRLKDICVVASCALLPYIIVRFLTTMMSGFLAGDEQIFLDYAVSVSKVWSAIIAFAGLQETHEYSFAKTILSVFLTIVGLIIILFITLMLVLLFQQLYAFIVTLIFEFRY